MSISTQITVVATAEQIIVTAPGALRGPMGDVTPEVTALVEQSQANASRAEDARDEASIKAADAADAASLADSFSSIAAGFSNPYTSISDGLANTLGSGPVNRFFSVPNPGNTLSVVYRNDAGSAVEIGSAPSLTGVTESTPNLWPDPFFSAYYAQYGAVSSIPGRLSGNGVLANNSSGNPYKGASIDIPSGTGIRNAAMFVPFSEMGKFKIGDSISAKVIVVTSGPVRLDVVTRDNINGPAIQSTFDFKSSNGVAELSASITLNAAATGLFLRVQVDSTNTNPVIVAAMVAGKGIGLGFSERTVSSSESKQISQAIVEGYKVPVLGTDFFRSGKNIYNSATRVDGSYINIEGNILVNSAYFYSDYMDVNSSSTYTANSSLRFILFYNSEKVFLGTPTSLQNLSQFTTPATAAFVRVSVVIALGEALQIESGLVSTSFEPYGYFIKDKDSNGTPIYVTDDNPVVVTERPNVYGFEFLRETHQRLRCISLGDVVRLNIGAIGDSWIHNAPRWILPTFTTLMAQYGGLGNGWIGLSTPSGGTTNGSVRGSGIATLTGAWTSAYATGGGPDAGSVTTSEVGATAFTNLNTYTAERNIYLLAMGGAGSITYTVGAASPVAVNLAAMTGVQKISLGVVTGAASVTVTVVSGVVTLFGMIESLTGKGVGFHKLGSTGSRAAQWEALDQSRFRPCIAALDLDLAIVSLGTNDQAVPATKDAFKASIEAIILNVRGARPAADMLLLAPCENQRGLPTPMSDYADAMYDLAVKYKLAFIDLQANFGEKAADYASGSARPWFLSDKIHPDGATGGRAIVNAVLAAITI